MSHEAAYVPHVPVSPHFVSQLHQRTICDFVELRRGCHWTSMPL